MKGKFYTFIDDRGTIMETSETQANSLLSSLLTVAKKIFFVHHHDG